jgi:hypothetical protein
VPEELAVPGAEAVEPAGAVELGFGPVEVEGAGG